MRQPRENRSDRIPSRHFERREEKEQRLFKRLIEDVAVIKNALFHVLVKENIIMAALDDIEREVGETEGAVQSAIVLIKGLRDQIAQAGTDPQKLADLVARLDKQQQDLAEAVAENPSP
jgi:TolA-binding protein